MPPTRPSTPTTKGQETQKTQDSEQKSKYLSKKSLVQSTQSPKQFERLISPKRISPLTYFLRCRLSKDSLTGWDCCSLTLQPCRTPLVSPQVKFQLKDKLTEQLN